MQMLGAIQVQMLVPTILDAGIPWQMPAWQSNSR